MPVAIVTSRTRDRWSRPVQGPYYPNLDSWQSVGLGPWYPLGDTVLPKYSDFSPGTTKFPLTLNGTRGIGALPLGGTGWANTGSTSNWLNSATSPVTVYPITLSIMFNVTSAVTAYNPLMLTDNGATSSEYIGMYLSNTAHSGTVGALIGHAGIGEKVGYSTTTFGANTPHMATVVFASASSRVAYLDGGGAGSDTNTITPTGIVGINVGAYRGVSSTFSAINGTVWDARVYNYAMVATQVAEMYANWSDLYYQPARVTYSFSQPAQTVNNAVWLITA